MSRAFSLVFLSMVVGGFSTLVWVPPGLLGRGFYRLMGGLYAALFALALWVERQVFETSESVARWGTAMMGLMGAYALLAWTPLMGMGYLLVVLAIPSGLAFLWSLSTQTALLYGIEGVARAMWHANVFVSSLLLGSATTAMLFGHWYLTTPRLSTHYLRRFGVVMMLALGVSGLLFVATLAAHWEALNRLGFVAFSSFGGIFLWSRVLLGFGVVGIGVGLAWSCLREGSTQAATGFFYLVVLFLLMGELLSRFLTEQTRLPL